MGKWKIQFVYMVGKRRYSHNVIDDGHEHLATGKRNLMYPF